jgi:hypothetical protein
LVDRHDDARRPPGRRQMGHVERAVPINKGKIEIPMYRSITVSVLMLAAALVSAGCAEDDLPTTPTDPPTEITESIAGTLTPNGGRTHTFTVQRAGEVIARIDSLAPEATIGISLGPMSVQACSARVSQDNAVAATTLAGQASSAGTFCVRVYDSQGSLSGPVDYAITLRHF